MSRPLAVDLYCGLGGWTDGLLAEGWDVVGFDLERHRYPARKFSVPDESLKSMSGKDRHGNTLMNRAMEQVHGFHTAELTGEWVEYPAQLVLQDVLTLHGSQFRNADLIVASPPCQEFSYMAMPWTLAKEKQARLQDDPEARKKLTALFDACFRIQREACEAAGRHIPLIVENVRGAQKWVGRSRWNYGSFHLWGDVPALMPMTKAAPKVGGIDFNGYGTPGYKAVAFNGTAEPRMREGQKLAGFRFDGSGRSFQSQSVEQTGVKVPSDEGRRTDIGNGARFTSRDCGVEQTGIKLKDQDGYERDHPAAFGWKSPRTSSSATSARKAASALIAKIPLPLSRYIARVFRPRADAA